MRIAIDASELIGRPTGVGRYVSELLAAWAGLPDAAAHDFILCATEPIECPRGSRLRVTTAIAPGHGTRWQQLTLPRLVRAARADVLLAPAYSAPMATRIPIVVSIHDLSFIAHPEWYGRTEGLRRRLLTRLTARRAAHIVACSEFTKREIVRHLGIEPGKVDVVYPGATALAARLSSPTRAATQSTGHREGGRLVIFVGSIFSRRHVPELIDGFSRLARRQPAVMLEIVGENRSNPHVDVDALIRATGMLPRIRPRSYVSDEQLASLYGQASACVFLSDYEGFGMTPLEALAAGVPILVLDTELTREVYGQAAMYVERPDPALIEAALARLLFDEAERTRLLDAAPAVLERYSWQDCAQRNLEILLASASEAAPHTVE